jgi:acyl-CoA dehydrogenase
MLPVGFDFSPEAEALREQLLDFMDAPVYPAEQIFDEQIEESGDPHSHPPIMEEPKGEAPSRGLWNLFFRTTPRPAQGDPGAH